MYIKLAQLLFRFLVFGKKQVQEWFVTGLAARLPDNSQAKTVVKLKFVLILLFELFEKLPGAEVLDFGHDIME